MFIDSQFQGIIDPSCIGPFQWSHKHYFAGEMINHNKDMNRPESPAQNYCGVDRPNMIRISGENWSILYFLLRFRRHNGESIRLSRFGPVGDISNRRGWHEDVQQCQLIGKGSHASFGPWRRGLHQESRMVIIGPKLLKPGRRTSTSGRITCTMWATMPWLTTPPSDLWDIFNGTAALRIHGTTSIPQV